MAIVRCVGMNRDSDAPPPREWIRELAEEHNVEPDDILMQSRRRDLLWSGTEADRKKAEWLADWWSEAVEGREKGAINVRGVHYYIYAHGDGVEPPTDCSWDEYANTKKCYKYLKEAAVLARALGTVPMDGLLDARHDSYQVREYGDHRVRVNAREVPVPSLLRTPTVPSPDSRVEYRKSVGSDPRGRVAETPLQTARHDLVDDLADSLASTLADSLVFDRARQSPYHVELWSEKSLPDYVHDVARDVGVGAVVEGKGDLSLTVAHNFAQRVDEAARPAVVLYLSDYDPKGDHMASAMAAKLAWLKQQGQLSERVVVDRLAITREQITALDLPRKPIDESEHSGTGGVAADTLKRKWEQRKGEGATELNTLEARPEDYRRIVREGIEQFRDPDIGRQNREAREEWRDRVEAMLREVLDTDTNADADRDRDHDDDLDEALADLREWAEHFDAALDRAGPVLELFDELANADPPDRVRDVVEQRVAEADLPAADVYSGSAPLPANPLYDSDRSYLENVASVKKYAHGADADDSGE